MTDVQTELICLLNEFHNICVKNQIVYHLIEQQLLFAEQEKSIHGYEADVAMSEKDFLLFQDCVQKLPESGREIEGLHNNPQMPGIYYRYVNSDTLLLDLDYLNAYKAFGVAINIHILRNCGFCQILLCFLEKGMYVSVQRRRRDIFPKMIVWILKKTLGTKLYVKLLISLFKKATLKNHDCYSIIKTPNTRSLIFHACFWKESSECRFMKLDLCTMKQKHYYLKKRYGKGWKSKNPPIRKETYMCICNANIPYSTYLERIANLNIITNQFTINRNLYWIKYNLRFKNLDVEQKKGWDILFFTEKRIQYWKRYMPHKQKLLQEYDNGNGDTATLMLNDYHSALRKYQKQKLALCFDQDIWEANLSWLRENGKAKYADLLSKILKNERLLPLEDESLLRWLESATMGEHKNGLN